VVLDGAANGDLIHAWSQMCQPGSQPAEFRTVYPYVTTVKGNRFTFRGGDQETMRSSIQKLFQARLNPQVKARVES
jgi:hypothetical protein